MTPSPSAEPKSRLGVLLSFLQQDPHNLGLIAEAASAAMDEGQAAEVAHLIDQYAALEPLSPPMLHLAGLLALHEARFVDAIGSFAPLLAANPDDPGLCFNMAWAQTMHGGHEVVVALVDDAVVDIAPRAASIKVQALHQLGRLEEALSIGGGYAARRPDDRALMSALAVVAIDASRPDLARDYALRAGETHEGLSTLGALALDQGDVRQSMTLFDRALDAYPQSPRALLGKGLALMAGGDQARATALIEQAAQIFGRHLGSWVAVGWGYFTQGDYAAARATFDKVLAMDDTFPETQGALAVLDAIEGNIDSAGQRAEIALRLDRKCFSAALARSLLAAARGDPATAERIRAVALNAPISAGGPTLGQAMARLNSGFGGSRA